MKLLSVYEVSDLLGLDIDAVYRYTRQGILPAVYIGRRVKYSEEQILDFINTGGKRNGEGAIDNEHATL